MEEANYLALRVTANDRSMLRKQTTFVESLSNRKTVPITVNCNSELSSRKIFQMAFTWLTNVTGCRLRSFLPGNGRFFDRNLDRDHVRSDVEKWNWEERANVCYLCILPKRSLSLESIWLGCVKYLWQSLFRHWKCKNLTCDGFILVKLLILKNLAVTKGKNYFVRKFEISSDCSNWLFL